MIKDYTYDLLELYTVHVGVFLLALKGAIYVKHEWGCRYVE